jgi:hypothetical protein
MSNEMLVIVVVAIFMIGFAWSLSYALRDDEPPIKKHS